MGFTNLQLGRGGVTLYDVVQTYPNMGLKIGYHHLEIVIFPNGNGYNKISIKPIWDIQ
jgi:hypothetical protein